MAVYDKVLNRWRRVEVGPSRASAKLTTLASPWTAGVVQDCRDIQSLYVTVKVTAKTGAPTLQVFIYGGETDATVTTPLSADSGALADPAIPSETSFRVQDVPNYAKVYATCAGGGADVTFSVTSEGK